MKCTLVTERKTHRCSYCGKFIPKGSISRVNRLTGDHFHKSCDGKLRVRLHKRKKCTCK